MHRRICTEFERAFRQTLIPKATAFSRPIVKSDKLYNQFSTMSPATNMPRVLLAFDFDHTIIDDNSDTYVINLAPEKKIPKEIKAMYSEKGWTHYMRGIFQYLHENNVTPQQILECMSEIKFSPGMMELLTNLDQAKTEVIIISDSNSIFIDHILDMNGIKDKVSKVFTNPAQFNDQGQLELEMYHFQESCSLSTVNLCKGHILEAFIAERASQNLHYSNIVYVGDGHNDLCPSLRLAEKDFVFHREGFSLGKYIKKMEAEKGLKIKANLNSWNSGHDIMQILNDHIPMLSVKN